MYETMKLTTLKRLRRKIERCSGECGKCGHMTFQCNTRGREIYFAVGCELAPEYIPIAEGPKTLREKLLEQIDFEIRAESKWQS